MLTLLALPSCFVGKQLSPVGPSVAEQVAAAIAKQEVEREKRELTAKLAAMEEKQKALEAQRVADLLAQQHKDDLREQNAKMEKITDAIERNRAEAKAREEAEERRRTDAALTAVQIKASEAVATAAAAAARPAGWYHGYPGGYVCPYGGCGGWRMPNGRCSACNRSI